VRATGVDALERRCSVRLPEDFRDYLLHRAPIVEDIWDDQHTAWWSLGRVKSVAEDFDGAISHPDIEARKTQYLVFADFLVWSWAWAVACTEDEHRGKVALIGGEPDRFVATTFTDFERLYAEDIHAVSP
jgi:hypothetical protein